MNPSTPISPGNDAAAVKHMSRGGLIVFALMIIAAVGAVAGVSVATHRDAAQERLERAAAIVDAADDIVAVKAALDAMEVKPLLNTAGDSVFNTAYINDGTGVVTTPNDAGVFTTIAGSPLTAGETDGSACITFSATTGLFTVANCGVGELELDACLVDFASSSNVAGTTTAAWFHGSTQIAASPVLRRTEPVDAGNGRSSLGCSVVTYHAASGDTLGFRLTNAGGGITGTTRAAGFRVRKVRNF